MSTYPGGRIPPKRDILLAIILTIVTFGIYDLVWDYYLGWEIRDHTNRVEIRPGLDVFFMIITFNIYYFFWLYKMQRFLQEQEARCFPGEAPQFVEPWLLVVAAIFGATIVSDAILQHDLNRHWERHARQG